MSEATHAEIVIGGSAERIMAVIADLPEYPKWSAGVRSAQVLQQFPDGRPKNVTLVLELGPIADSFGLEYAWQGNERVDWWLTDGTLLSDLRGTYACADNGDGTTTVTYDLAVELAVPMIGAVRQRGERHIVRAALRGLKRFVEADG